MEDNSREKTPAVEKVDRRHGSLPGKLEFQEFQPSITAANGSTFAQK